MKTYWDPGPPPTHQPTTWYGQHTHAGPCPYKDTPDIKCLTCEDPTRRGQPTTRIHMLRKNQ